MSHEGVPLQVDLFTRELADTRSAKQRRSDLERTTFTPLMFSQREIVPEVGMKARPKLPIPEKVTRPALWTDPRTEEEIERDIQREAEKLTIPLFAIVEPSPATAAVEVVEPVPQLLIDDLPPVPELEPFTDEDEPDEALAIAPETPAADKFAVYLELVQVSEDEAGTLWIDPRYQEAHQAQLGLVIEQAQRAGLTSAEIKMAITIGSQRATTQQRRIEGKTVAYLRVVATVEEHTQKLRAHLQTPDTGHTDEAYRLAVQAGLTQDELWLAVIIGAHRSLKHTASPPPNSPISSSA